MLDHITTTKLLKELLMEDRNFSYSSVGTYLDCSPSHAYRLLNGKRTMKLKHFLDLLFLCNITMIDFYSIYLNEKDYQNV